jgi:uncharacterized protein YcgL (UPF0745 family)
MSTKCYIYRCSRKPDMYIYLAEKDDFSDVPAVIMNGLGITEFSMELELDAGKKLARVNVTDVMANLKENGFHLQLPDNTPVEEIMARISRQTSHH